MTRRIAASQALALSVALCVCLQTHAQTTPKDCYKDYPTVVGSEIDKVARQIVRDNDAELLDAKIDVILFYTIADALAEDEARVGIRDLRAYQYLGETARTDKQVGATARGAGSTSAAEKPGYVDLLGFAIEHGTIQQQLSDTSVTLSTTPYAFVAALNEDSPDTYKKYGKLAHIGLSATFNLSDDDELPPLASVRRSQFDEASVKIRLNRDRSSRSEEFRAAWVTNAKPAIESRLKAITFGQSELFALGGGLDQIRRTRYDTLFAKVKASLARHANDAGRQDEIRGKVINEAIKKEIAELILCEMGDVFNQVQNGQITVREDVRRSINNEVVPALFRAQAELDEARKWLDEFIDEQDKKPKLTFAYTYKNQEMASDYSVAKFLYAQSFFKQPVKVVWNGGFSFYHDPDPMMNQETWRDFATALSFEGKTDSPFVRKIPDMSKVTFSLTGRYQRLRENRGVLMKKADILVSQFKVEIPIAAGLSIPLSVTYANATELIKEEHVRGNFGLTFDLDKFAAFTRLLKQ